MWSVGPGVWGLMGIHPEGVGSWVCRGLGTWDMGLVGGQEMGLVARTSVSGETWVLGGLAHLWSELGKLAFSSVQLRSVSGYFKKCR